MKEFGIEETEKLHPREMEDNHYYFPIVPNNHLLYKSSVLETDCMQVSVPKLNSSEAPLQLLLFVDQRSRSQEQTKAIHQCLSNLKTDYPFELKIIDVGKQPYLAEHYKLVATPALIKILPEPRHTLAGSNLAGQLEKWWSRWQRSVADHLTRSKTEENNYPESVPQNSLNSMSCSVELIRLSDEIFRLEQEKAELQAQLKFKDRMIEMLAHDLRNPLTAAAIAMETIELCHPVDERVEPRLTPTLMNQLLKQARNQTRSMDRMITDLLEAARGTNSELGIYPQRLDIGPLCSEVLSHFHNQIASKSLHIKKDIPKDLPYVYADQERVRQVITNLIDNAIKYTPAGGTICVSILHRTTQKIQVSIIDTGPGIPEEKRDRIFEDHFRLKRDENQQGYGIGLSLCQRIIRAHYGRIWVEASPTGGSCFQFTLPVYRF